MLPMYERLNTPKPFFRIPFGKIAIAVVSLPLLGFFFCVIWSVMFDFERATSTHCDVANYLPSISAAIGNYQPQKTVWRLAIIIHFPARLAVSKMYMGYYRHTIRRNRRFFGTIACICNVVEDLALLSLTLWTSMDDYPIHRNSFVVFIVSSEIYMLISYFLNKNGRKVAMSPIEEKSLIYKRNLFITNVVSFFLAGYCFLRHNSRCESGGYSIFAYFEYWFIWTVANYRATACLDLQNCFLLLDFENGLQFYNANYYSSEHILFI